MLNISAKLQPPEFCRLILHCRNLQENLRALISCPPPHLGLLKENWSVQTAAIPQNRSQFLHLWVAKVNKTRPKTIF
jgi:hypothetical protein